MDANFIDDMETKPFGCDLITENALRGWRVCHISHRMQNSHTIPIVSRNIFRGELE